MLDLYKLDGGPESLLEDSDLIYIWKLLLIACSQVALGDEGGCTNPKCVCQPIHRVMRILENKHIREFIGSDVHIDWYGNMNLIERLEEQIAKFKGDGWKKELRDMD